MMEIAQYHAARVRERSRTERFRRKTLVAKAADTPLTAGILPCSTMKLTVPLEPKLHTAARALGTGYAPRSETPKDVVDQADGLAVAAERFSSRLREASNPRWSGKPTVPISPKLAHMRSRSRPMGTVSRTRQTAAPAAGSLHNSSRGAETSAASTDGRDHEGDNGPRPVESLAVETVSFSSRLRESSGTRWTGRPTIPSSPRFSRAKAWRHPGLNQSAVQFERFTRHPLGPGTPSHSQDTPRVGTTLREEAERFTKKLRENVASWKWAGRITVPKSPNLSHNRGGSRVNTTFCMADSRAFNSSGLETSFKARPAPSSTRRPHAVPLGPLRASTKPKSPNLRTRIRSEIAPSRIGDDAENDRHKFIARPVPRRILAEVQFTVDLGPEKVTVPQGPEFNTQKRSLERSMQKSFISSDESAVSSAKYNDISSIPVTGDEDATTTSELSTSHPL
ncbi:hypothetical protein Pmar_PMAR007774 [Perkinsus marinus ATCC 50983]|uniref:Uncharacterized protein n=1 Tax=Perkinsus marinus (strain ATCC 50983 / TXsc) TaxID=423536 RepID=C5KYT8_PERM5|nr:hypothetical protein Pmar_PMAR007774 [Perkinsus marinus ATCC 50983]EER10366.1 hypothetical protein Pmar_PMAR007774 [Perkinsus marinus ATCC 50983]|eukprot:XP_002778571.1 hypothetical protein Pmar_PMAR007774 [Perkinsus marinus ATCC 50983]